MNPKVFVNQSPWDLVLTKIWTIVDKICQESEGFLSISCPGISSFPHILIFAYPYFSISAMTLAGISNSSAPIDIGATSPSLKQMTRLPAALM